MSIKMAIKIGNIKLMKIKPMNIKRMKIKRMKISPPIFCLFVWMGMAAPVGGNDENVHENVSENLRGITVSSKPTITPLVELYTSEGCSSCPPADELLSSLGNANVEEFTLVPLAFHVDYWNYLGWRDPFSQSKFTKRQRFIGAINRQRSIYTPELVVAGKEVRGGGQIYALVEKYNRKPALVHIKMNLETVSPTRITADMDIDNMAQGKNAAVFLAVFENNISRNIEAGENAGRTLKHDFVVRHWSNPYRLQAGMTQKSVVLPIGKDWNKQNLGVAVVVLDSENGETLQAVSATVAALY